ncbi:MAG: hypothetical protein QNL62_20580 [Gammaproteobacteria bacterium]|nr:hypothetical protein [Gammaproteobacteria bacterium]
MYLVLQVTIAIILSVLSHSANAYREFSDKEWDAAVYYKDISSTALFSFTPKDNPDGHTDIGVEFDKFKVGGECRAFLYIESYIPQAQKKLLNLTDNQITEMENGFKNATVTIDGLKSAPMSDIWLEMETSGDSVRMTIRYLLLSEIVHAMMQGKVMTLSLTTDNVLKVTLSGAYKTIDFARQICD